MSHLVLGFLSTTFHDFEQKKYHYVAIKKNFLRSSLTSYTDIKDYRKLKLKIQLHINTYNMA